MGARKQTAKRNLMSTVFPLGMPAYHVLHGFEQGGGNERFMRAAIALTRPLEDSNVNGIAEDCVEIAAIDGLSELLANRLS